MELKSKEAQSSLVNTSLEEISLLFRPYDSPSSPHQISLKEQELSH